MLDVNVLKVVHISTHLRGGGGIAAYRLHQSLLKNGVDSSFLSLDVGVDMFNTYQAQRIEISLCQRIFNKLLRLIFGANFTLNREIKYNRRLKNLLPYLNCEIASIPFSAYNILAHPSVQKADIIHLHWVAGILDYPSFFKHNQKPVVWTFHDMNSFLGLFHYEGDRTINLEKSYDLTNEIHELKRKSITNRKCKLTYVTPSDWLGKVAQESEIFKDIKGENIYNAIDTKVFFPQNNQDLRDEFKIPKENTVFLFIAEKLNNYRKGFDILLEALKKIPEYNLTILVIGDRSESKISLPDVRVLGVVNSEDELSKYYSLADAYIISSREDNLPNVMLESMACGTPVLSFEIGGMATVIENGFNGLKSPEISVSGLAQILIEFINTKEKYDREKIRNFAVDNFSFNKISNSYQEVYQSLLV